jgi:hypothetical protein
MAAMAAASGEMSVTAAAVAPVAVEASVVAAEDAAKEAEELGSAAVTCNHLAERVEAAEKANLGSVVLG